VAARRQATGRQRRPSLAEALQAADCYDHAVDGVTLAETHISWVFLTGKYAYKVKKPVKLPFLDFSTLRKRKHFCEQELAVNRRLAPQLYLGVVPIGGSPARPRIGKKPAFEYAVKMRQFPPEARLDRVLAEGRLTQATLAEFADTLAHFHAKMPPLHTDAEGRAVRAAALDNFTSLEPYAPATCRDALRALHAWTVRELAVLAQIFRERVANGSEREGHGDLHLENLLLRDGKIVAYDALEFDPQLRSTDVVSETSFLAMDLVAHGRPDLAFTFLNRYFETSGDYAGIEVLRFYLVYRAVVRAKVQAIKAAQRRAARHSAALEPYLSTATSLTGRRRPLLVVTHGLSGSGKTFITDELVGRLPALRVRSDVERKRLHGLAASARSGSGVGQGIYGGAASRATYVALASTADRALRHGFDTIVDATFLRRRERAELQQVAAANAARFAILECVATERELRRRIAARAAAGRDASEANLAVLDRQLAAREPLAPWERRAAVRVDTERPVSYSRIVRALATR
jgi:aminoglycoside phosphotransferase family enzyme/predicted kinase